MVLKINKKEYDSLISSRVLIPYGDKTILYLKPDLTGYCHELLVDVEVSDVPVIVDIVQHTYQELRKVFPTDTLKVINNQSGGDNLRTGKKESIIKSIKELLKTYTSDDIINAAKYEIQSRINKSRKTGKDELTFMKRLGSWVNDAENIESMIENYNSNTVDNATHSRGRIF